MTRLEGGTPPRVDSPGQTPSTPTKATGRTTWGASTATTRTRTNPHGKRGGGGRWRASASAEGDPLGCSSAFTRGVGAAAALAAGAASVASAEDMEAERSAGLLMGLRSGVRRVSA